MAKNSSNVKKVYRSAVSGKYVTKKYAETHPRTTVKETRKIEKK